MQNSSTILAHRPTSNPLSTVFGRAGGCCLVSWGRRGPHRKHSGGRSHRHGAISDRKRSPRVKCRIYPLAPSGSTRCVSYDFWALLFPASSPPALASLPVSCSYGREFATRFFQLRLAATPCVSLRLPSSVPVGSFHPTRFCPCWAHWGRRFRLPTDSQLLREL